MNYEELQTLRERFQYHYNCIGDGYPEDYAYQ